ncbi:MAG: glutathione S-transferase family protein [Pseudomonadota bacterium]
MKLYGTPPTRAIRVQWLLNELGIDCEVIGLDPRGKPNPEFLALNPAGKLPVLVDGEVVLTESAAIPLYLAEKHPEKGLIPSNLADRAQMYRWIFFLVTEIEQPLWRIALNTFIYAEEDRVPADIKNAARDCRKMMVVFEKHMKDREFVAGNHLSVADFIAAYTLDWAGEAEMLGDAPRLKAYVEKMYQRPTAPMTIKESFAALAR